MKWSYKHISRHFKHFKNLTKMLWGVRQTDDSKLHYDLPEVSKWSWRVLELVLSAAFSNARPKKLEYKEMTTYKEINKCCSLLHKTEEKRRERFEEIWFETILGCLLKSRDECQISLVPACQTYTSLAAALFSPKLDESTKEYLVVKIRKIFFCTSVGFLNDSESIIYTETIKYYSCSFVIHVQRVLPSSVQLLLKSYFFLSDVSDSGGIPTTMTVPFSTSLGAAMMRGSSLQRLFLV